MQSSTTFDAMSVVLAEKFQVDPARVQPQSTLETLGLDSLGLMEFVFAVEDRFDVRIPEDRLDPRQAGITLEQLAALLDEAVAAKSVPDAAVRIAGRMAASRSPEPVWSAPWATTVRRSPKPCSPAARRSAPARSTCPASTCRRWAVAPAEFEAETVVAPSRVPLDRGTAMALRAAADAARTARIDAACPAERLGVFWGSGMAGAATFEATCRTVFAERRRMRPTSVVTTMPNAAAAEIALLFGARGAALAYACACASSAVAIGEAMRAIRAGWIDVAIAGGSESMLTPGVLSGWQAMRVLAPVRIGADADNAGACRPFDTRRAGFALGEAAAAFVLESAAHAEARGAAAEAFLCGYATNCDGMHITHPDADGQARAMRAALADAGLQPGAIGYVNAHGTATPAGDRPRRSRWGASSVPMASRSARARPSTGTCSAPAARSSCW
jgi:acyl carrier protein